MRKTAIFITLAILGNSFGNLLLSIAMHKLPGFSFTAFPHYLHGIVTDPLLIPGTVLTVIYSLSQLSLFSWADLSYVVPFIATSYVLTTLLSEFVLGEHVTAARWIGVLLITTGVIIISRTPPQTHEGPKEHDLQ